MPHRDTSKTDATAKTDDDRPGQPAIFMTGRGDADARFVSGAITDYAVAVTHSEGICD